MKDLSPLVLSLDSSTTACKAIIWDCRGTSLARGYSSLAMLSPRPGWHEQPAESWWESMTDAIRQAVSQVDHRRLKALCIAHQRETFVPLDEHDRPLINGILWMDERARELLPSLEQTLGEEEFHRLTGKKLSVNLTIAKIAWLKEHRAEVGCYANAREAAQEMTHFLPQLNKPNGPIHAFYNRLFEEGLPAEDLYCVILKLCSPMLPIRPFRVFLFGFLRFLGV